MTRCGFALIFVTSPLSITVSLQPQVTPMETQGKVYCPCHSRRRERLDWDSLPALSDISVSKSYNCINMLYTKIQNKTTTVVVFTVSHTYSPESHLHIQKLYIYIYRSKSGTYSDEPLLVCWPGRMRKITVSFFCTYTD